MHYQIKWIDACCIEESISAYDTIALDQSFDVFDSLTAGSDYNIENSVYPYILFRLQSGLYV